ncbi:asparagine synthase [Sesbania bispinosa]|nr:asparagine synthase [Sesbania bispinosa]
MSKMQWKVDITLEKFHSLNLKGGEAENYLRRISFISSGHLEGEAENRPAKNEGT